MKLVWQTYRTNIGDVAEAAVEELCDRLRALNGAPVKLIVLQPGKIGPVDAVVICRNRPALTWLWLTYDCLGPRQKEAVRLVPHVASDAYVDCRVSELMREHLGWKPRKRRR